jgi:Rrf2 family protein
MQLTLASQYALQFLVELAADKSGRPVTSYSVASTRNIPFSPVQKLLGRLAKARILHVARGHQGGCRLARPPHQLTLLEIIQAVEGPSIDHPNVPWQPRDGGLDRRLMEAVEQADRAGRAELARVRLSELVRG